jgi:hypothetical protein
MAALLPEVFPVLAEFGDSDGVVVVGMMAQQRVAQIGAGDHLIHHPPLLPPPDPVVLEVPKPTNVHRVHLGKTTMCGE